VAEAAEGAAAAQLREAEPAAAREVAVLPEEARVAQRAARRQGAAASRLAVVAAASRLAAVAAASRLVAVAVREERAVRAPREQS
jgi:hypothetical protein